LSLNKYIFKINFSTTEIVASESASSVERPSSLLVVSLCNFSVMHAYAFLKKLGEHSSVLTVLRLKGACNQGEKFQDFYGISSRVDTLWNFLFIEPVSLGEKLKFLSGRPEILLKIKGRYLLKRYRVAITWIM
jgi:hypothetical protein